MDFVMERRALAQFFLIFWLFSRGNTSPRTRRSPKRRTRRCRPDGTCRPDGALPPSLAAHAGASLGLCRPSRAPLLSVRVTLPFTCPSTARHSYSPGAALTLRSKSRSVQSALKYLVRARPLAVYCCGDGARRFTRETGRRG